MRLGMARLNDPNVLGRGAALRPWRDEMLERAGTRAARARMRMRKRGRLAAAMVAFAVRGGEALCITGARAQPLECHGRCRR